MLPFRCVYRDDFDLPLGNQAFPSLKYKLIRERMIYDGLALPEDFVARRDRLLFQTSRHAGIPVVVVFAGGYAVRLEDTVAIHINTILAAADVYRHALLPKSLRERA